MASPCDVGTGPVVDSCTSVEPSVVPTTPRRRISLTICPSANKVGERTHRCAAAGLQGGEQGSLGGHGGPGVRVVELGEHGGEVHVDRGALDSQGPLAGGGQDGVDRQELGHLVGPADAVKPGGGEHDGVELPTA